MKVELGVEESIKKTHVYVCVIIEKIQEKGIQ